MMYEVKLTQYSHGAGCGCKISPAVLTEILGQNNRTITDPMLIVGNENRDDAAVYDMGNGMAIISTTDFFMPIVDEPFTFGKISAANAISDVYAMGGKPLLAIAILGWPIDKIPVETARIVLEGARHTCNEAGICIAGGHSIDSPEPIFGLAVTGQVEIKNLKRNDSALSGSRLYITKPLGVGILTTAQKKGMLLKEHAQIAPNSMIKLNSIGNELAKIQGLTAMTDVTGFGLLGHLAEICEGSKLSAVLDFSKIPVFREIDEYINMKCIPGGTYRNWDSYNTKVNLQNEKQKTILCDPQTSGGLLLAVSENAVEEVERLLSDNNIVPICFGELTPQSNILITVE